MRIRLGIFCLASQAGQMVIVKLVGIGVTSMWQNSSRLPAACCYSAFSSRCAVQSLSFVEAAIHFHTPCNDGVITDVAAVGTPIDIEKWSKEN
jgi:hypothetical protein